LRCFGYSSREVSTMTPLPLPSQTLAWLNHAADAGQRDAKALLHLIDRADKRDRDVAEFVDSYFKTIAALCRRLEALERGANDLPAPEAPADDGPVADGDLPARVLAMCRQRNWSLDWTCRGAYLHLESSELIEALRGKRGNPKAEAADVLLVLMSITENAGIPWGDVLEQVAATCTQLENCGRYSGEEWTALVEDAKGTESDSVTATAPAPAPARAGSADSPIPMLHIPAGRFLMGSPANEPGRYDDEGPQHGVTLAAFWMAQTPITQAQWREVAGWQKLERDLDPDPSNFKGANRPVEQVSWLDAMEFCHRLSQRTGQRYGLPSEAQWEYACRAGSTTPFHFGATLTPELANYDGNYTYGQGPKGAYREQTTDVGSFPANPWGLHDMHGNVWEWCLDHWHHGYEGAPADGSAWEDHSLGESPAACCAAGRGATTPRTAARPAAASTARSPAAAASVSASVASDASRLLRGGSWLYHPAYCRSACRVNNHPDIRDDNFGFRVCCLPQD
jgi:formylglycine-generating enzyme required for sulfatase activity